MLFLFTSRLLVCVYFLLVCVYFIDTCVCVSMPWVHDAAIPGLTVWFPKSLWTTGLRNQMFWLWRGGLCVLFVSSVFLSWALCLFFVCVLVVLRMILCMYEFVCVCVCVCLCVCACMCVECNNNACLFWSKSVGEVVFLVCSLPARCCSIQLCQPILLDQLHSFRCRAQ